MICLNLIAWDCRNEQTETSKIIANCPESIKFHHLKASLLQSGSRMTADSAVKVLRFATNRKLQKSISLYRHRHDESISKRHYSQHEHCMLVNVSILCTENETTMDMLPFTDDIHKRSASFITECLKSDSTLVRSVAKFGIIVGRCDSILGRNTLLCCSHFGWKSDDFVSGSIDFSNCTLLRT